MVNYSNLEFENLILKYKNFYYKWSKRICKRTGIDSDTLWSEFLYTLFKVSKHCKDQSKFSSYFFSSMKKKTASIIRQQKQIKQKSQKNSYSIDLFTNHLMIYDKHYIDVHDLIKFISKDDISYRLLVLKLQGYNVENICESLHIKRNNYFNRLKEVKESYCKLDI